MNIHEFQAKEILRKYGIPIPDFGVASNGNEVQKVIDQLQLKEAIVKIQVHAGGRGKAGGVKFAKSPEEILETAKNMLGMKMVNNQTGPLGVVAHQVMLSRPADIEKEYYIGAIIDRDNARPVLIASPEGGMEIEEKVIRVLQKIAPSAPHEVLLVLDATTGQNGVDQAEVFHSFTPLTGIVLAKLDGSAKGGVVVSIYRKLGIPVEWVGVGEKIDDLMPFDKMAYANAIFSGK